MDSEFDIFRKSIDLKRKLLRRKNPEEDFVFVSQNPAINLPDTNDKGLQNNIASAMECDLNSTEPEIDKYIKLLNQNSKKYLDHVYGVYKKQNTLMIGDSPLHLEKYQVKVKESSFPLTKGLLELLFKKQPNTSLISDVDLHNYRLILETSNAHKKQFIKEQCIRRQKSYKFKGLIAPMFENQLSELQILKRKSDSKSECSRELKKVCRNGELNSVTKNQFKKKESGNRNNSFTPKIDFDHDYINANDSSTYRTDEEDYDEDYVNANDSSTYGTDEEDNDDDQESLEMDDESNDTDEESDTTDGKTDDYPDYKSTTVNCKENDKNSVNYTTWDDPNDLVDRLRYLIKQQSQNKCTCHVYEIGLILSELRKEGYIY